MDASFDLRESYIIIIEPLTSNITLLYSKWIACDDCIWCRPSLMCHMTYHMMNGNCTEAVRHCQAKNHINLCVLIMSPLIFNSSNKKEQNDNTETRARQWRRWRRRWWWWGLCDMSLVNIVEPLYNGYHWDQKTYHFNRGIMDTFIKMTKFSGPKGWGVI